LWNLTECHMEPHTWPLQTYFPSQLNGQNERLVGCL
jgi:hypothetical protein